jgi:hypothetical protein
MKLVHPLVTYLPHKAVGLDYGCGPALSIEPLMRERGMRCASYDPIFAPRRELLMPNTYDFISCSEVVEHFRDPGVEFRRLHGMVKRGGILGVMTRLVPDDFRNWWYHRDPTHVVFYTEATFHWIAAQVGFDLLEHHDGVVLLQRV